MEKSPKRRPKWKLWAIFIPVIALLLTVSWNLVTIAPPIYSQGAEKLRTVVLALRVYAADNDGQFPDNLESLIPDYIDDRDVFIIKDESGKRHEMIYHPSHSDPSLSRLPIVEFPRQLAKKRMVGFADGSVVGLYGNR